eukprot:CAMPEP_0116068126 /NCGR_PEP_ID=MMETSP0322-20121206/11470_1 /TAXON_ID=163516 /ORGANISM="Leptocylindrus danicus var. apora, Strain B651" /LENGTH=258 /DNA_ID=CAMNT_0003555167 /DNA_START=93 /DNA_END=869 /DNA_ORIENTATION=-
MSTNSSSDVSAFFAKKKGKKKTFKFNANKVEAETIAVMTSDVTTANENFADNGTSSKEASELLDMKALEEQRKIEDDVATKMALEETRAQLATAKLNMEKEAQRIEEEKKEKERIEKEKADAIAAREAERAASMSNKWVPLHRRSEASTVARGNLGSKLGKVNTMDDEAFPDLGLAATVPQDSKPKMPKMPAKKAVVKPDVEEKKLEEKRYEESKQTDEIKDAKLVEISTEPFVTETPTAKPVVKKKKKKKDLSTFGA